MEERSATAVPSLASDRAKTVRDGSAEELVTLTGPAYHSESTVGGRGGSRYSGANTRSGTRDASGGLGRRELHRAGRAALTSVARTTCHYQPPRCADGNGAAPKVTSWTDGASSRLAS